MKIGIYGGSFNPPHLGHQNAAVEAAEKCALDKLLLIPAGIPPAIPGMSIQLVIERWRTRAVHCKVHAAFGSAGRGG